VPTFDLNEYATQFEPIEIKNFGGEDYTISVVTDKMMTDIINLTQDDKKDPDTNVLNRQLGIMFGKDAKHFENVDVRQKMLVAQFVVDKISKQMSGEGEEGNESKPGSGATE